MKKILLSLVLVASVSLGASAQPKGGDCKCNKKSKFTQELNLTSDQQEKMKALSEDFKTKSDGLRDQQRDLRKSHQAEMKAILTPEQQAKWQEMADKRSKRDHRGGKHFGHKNRGGKRMNFDAATTEKLDDLRSNFEKEKKVIEMSRIAPEVQKDRIQNLKEKYRNNRREIIKEASPQKEKNRAA